MGDNQDADSMWSDSDGSSSNSSNGFHHGLFDPLHFSTLLVSILLTFVVYLLLPRGIRKQYCGAYPKRHAWSARSRQQQQQQQRGVRISTCIHWICGYCRMVFISLVRCKLQYTHC
jgi:hypothetical protein